MHPRRRTAWTVGPLAMLALSVGPLVVGAGAAEAPPAPTIVPFEDWAPAGCPVATEVEPWPVERVVVHHTHEPIAATEADVVPTLAEICRVHIARGFETIGYHYVVDPWGTVWQARGLLPDAEGRAPRAQLEGAHVAGANPGAVGVAFLGDHEATPPTEAAVAAAIDLLAWLAPSTGADPHDVITVETTGEGTSLVAGTMDVHALDGHDATNATVCPGQHLTALLGPMRDAVTERLAGREASAEGVLAAMDPVTRAPDDPGTHTATLRPVSSAPPVPPQRPSRLLALLPVLVVAAFGRGQVVRARAHG